MLPLQINNRLNLCSPQDPGGAGVARVPLGVPGRMGAGGRGACLKTRSVATPGLDAQAPRLRPPRPHSPQGPAVLSARSPGIVASVYAASHPEYSWNNRGYKHRWKDG